MNTENKIKRLFSNILTKIRQIRINQNLMVYIIMLIISLVAWTVNKIGSELNSSADFKIEYYGIPQNNILVPGITTNKVKVSFMAHGGEILVRHGIYPPLRIDLSKIELRTFPESDSTLKFVINDDIRTQVENQLPPGYQFVSMRPDTIKLDFGVSRQKKVAIKLNSEINFAPQYRLSKNPILNPDSIIISGSAIITDTINYIETEFLTIDKLNANASQRVKLNFPDGINSAFTATEVSIIVEKFTESTIEVPIKIINTPDSVALKIFSQNALLKYNVSWNNYKKISPEMFSVIVDYNDLLGISKPNFLQLKLAKNPENLGISNISISPEAVEYLIERTDTTTSNQ